MGRKKLEDGEKLEILTIYIQGKYLKGKNKDELRAVAHKSVVEHVKSSEKENNVLNQTFYKGYVITPNLTGYVNYDFCKEDCEIIKGHGKSIDDCKIQIDEILENE